MTTLLEVEVAMTHLIQRIEPFGIIRSNVSTKKINRGMRFLFFRSEIVKEYTSPSLENLVFSKSFKILGASCDVT